jgi:hypothetical protein
MHIQVLSAFHGVHPDFGGLGTLCTPPKRAGPLTAPQASLDATDRSVAPLEWLSTWASTPDVPLQHRQLYYWAT